MSFMEFLYALSGIFLCPFWNFSMPFLEFLYVLSGISLCPFWNFSMPFVEFLYVLCGIFLCPFWNFSMSFSPCKWLKLYIFSPSKSSNNQVLNQGNQSSNQSRENWSAKLVP